MNTGQWNLSDSGCHRASSISSFTPANTAALLSHRVKGKHADSCTIYTEKSEVWQDLGTGVSPGEWSSWWPRRNGSAVPLSLSLQK